MYDVECMKNCDFCKIKSGFSLSLASGPINTRLGEYVEPFMAVQRLSADTKCCHKTHKIAAGSHLQQVADLEDYQIISC